jgi:hypothetical protein
MIRDLAVGDKSDPEMAEEYGVAEQTVRYFRMNHKHEIAAVLADWTTQYDHIWSTKLETHLRFLTQRLEEIEDLIAALYEHARRETETIRNVDPDASEVLVNDRVYLAYVKEQRSLIREIATRAVSSRPVSPGSKWTRKTRSLPSTQLPSIPPRTGTRCNEHHSTRKDLPFAVPLWSR